MINTEQVLPWHEVEASVVKEKKWLREVFDFSEFERGRDLQNLPISLDEMLRQISVSIVRGDIKVKELKSKQANSLWVDDVTNLEQFENDEKNDDNNKKPFY